MKILIFFLFLFVQLTSQLNAQIYKPDLQNKTTLSVGKRQIENIEEEGKKGVRIKEGNGNNVITISSIEFSNGAIEFDAKGRDIMGGSFLGLAFHIQNDSSYDAIYFRPFNFSNPDTVRRWRAVQYIALPGHEWDKLREQYPGKYENKVTPVPHADKWFHCKILVNENKISVFVNDSPGPSLVVEKLSTTRTGKIGLWVENGCDGRFANLSITTKK